MDRERVSGEEGDEEIASAHVRRANREQGGSVQEARIIAQ